MRNGRFWKVVGGGEVVAVGCFEHDFGGGECVLHSFSRVRSRTR